MGIAAAEPLPRADLLRHRLVGLTKLVEITRRLAGVTELEEILKIVTDGACEALECERATLFLYDAQTRELYSRKVTTLEIAEIRNPVDKGISGWAGRNRKVANVADPTLDSRWNAEVDRRTGFQTRGVLAAPLISPRDERLLGVLELLNKENSSTFDAADEELLQAFAAHAAVSLERVELLENHRRNQQLEGSLEAARRVQARLLPERLPEISGYELAAWWRPALGVGGDYYDVLPTPNGVTALTVADVSGHGLAPALIMASARAMLHVLARTMFDPADTLTILAETIAPDLQLGRFITFFLATLDPQAHLLEFVNAGHGPALHLCRQTGRVRQLESTGLPIGMMESPYRRHPEPVSMQPGDLVVLATDGAVELQNCDGDMFGRGRFEHLIRVNQSLSAPRLLDLLKNEITNFNECRAPDDDITIVILERKRGA
jgi:phosphoserine phosphatase RsbU/P